MYRVKLRPTGYKKFRLYQIVVVPATSGLYNPYLAKIGYIRSLGINERLIIIDRKELYFWLKKGLYISKRLNKFISKEGCIV